MTPADASSSNSSNSSFSYGSFGSPSSASVAASPSSEGRYERRASLMCRFPFHDFLFCLPHSMFETWHRIRFEHDKIRTQANEHDSDCSSSVCENRTHCY